MALKDTKFDAFISYRHAELDKFVAESIHKRLETFRLPSSVKRKNKLAKDRINRVFRDRDELPLASDLAEQITAALENSEFLIVICTPRLPESKWCRKEIETFIEMHGRQNVFAVLAEGEPSESFPDLLLYDEKEVVSETGVTEIVRVPVEPLAADVRGANKKEIRKKMDEELLRLVAPMFNLNYDDLKQRHREQKMKRIVSLSMIVSSIFIAFGIFSGILSLKISQQADEIYEQNTLIQNKNEEISKQAELLQQQNDELQKSYAVSMALEAQELMADGRHYDALYAVRNAMPDSSSDLSIPYSADAEKSLTDILQIYKSPNLYFPKYVFDVNAPVESFKVSDDGTKLLISDMKNTLTLWDVEGQVLLASFSLYDGNKNLSYHFIDNDTFIYSSPEKVYRYNISTASTLEIKDKPGEIILIPGSDDIFLFEILKLSRITSVGSVVWEMNTLEMGFYATEYVCTTKDGSLLSLPATDMTRIIDSQTGEILRTLPHTTMSEFVMNDSLLYVLDSKASENVSDIYCYDITTGNLLWKKNFSDFFYDIYFIPYESGTNMLITNTFDSAIAINGADGKIISTAVFDKKIAAISCNPGGNTAIITLNSNTNYIFMPEQDEAIQITLTDSYKPRNQIAQAKWIPSAVFYSYLDTSMVSYYSGFNVSDDYSELGQNEFNNYKINKAGTYRLESSDSIAYLYDLSSNSVINTISLNDSRCYFVGDGTEYYILVSDNECTVYTLKDNQPVHTFTSDNRLVFKDNYILEQVYTNEGKIGRAHLLNDLGTYYDFSEDVYFSFQDLYICDATLSYALVYPSQGSITLGNLHNPEEKIEIQTDISSIEACAISDNGKYFFVEHEDSRIEIYNMSDGSIQTILYDMDMDIGRIEYIADKNVYFMYSKYEYPNYALTTDLEVCSDLPNMLAYNKEEKLMICFGNTYFYTLPYYPYEALIKMADERLGDYAPSEKIKRKHNI